ncbi:hypothetical protein [Geodermatophilus sabuli]|uniref:Excalibur calcium-binding domain-containing protein n=1 Tax=Geodermatophilus sabuli TaxID=1564158 RepID=A0A285EKD3_9ACTN|nr:hypothetical protein [Geodermatophilus sabuli]MBB3086121.1 hypothetical protein [Geodermatophilus sabuli]SNX98461.1 Excalibur calcium-binding domain-containing protein [Geodermatophilus sabuli]
MVRRGIAFHARNGNSSGRAAVSFAYGNPGDVVLVGDWDGNGTLGVRRDAGGVPPNPGDAVNCPDFAMQEQAQEWFNRYHPYYGDVAGLDVDGDLIACETLS